MAGEDDKIDTVLITEDLSSFLRGCSPSALNCDPNDWKSRLACWAQTMSGAASEIQSIGIQAGNLALRYRDAAMTKDANEDTDKRDAAFAGVLQDLSNQSVTSYANITAGVMRLRASIPSAITEEAKLWRLIGLAKDLASTVVDELNHYRSAQAAWTSAGGINAQQAALQEAINNIDNSVTANAVKYLQNFWKGLGGGIGDLLSNAIVKPLAIGGGIVVGLWLIFRRRY